MHGLQSSARDEVECPLRVNRAVLTLNRPLPVYADERTSSDRPGWSGSCQEETHAPQQTASLFDHLVGELLQMERHVEAERLGRLEVDQLELGGLPVARLSASICCHA
jgi:hypothetical protein